MTNFTPVPYYCEENIWKLLESTAQTGHEWFAIVLSNPARHVALFNQCNDAGEVAVIWDYHVVALERFGPASLIWDFNTLLEIPCPADFWFNASFQVNRVPATYRPCFRVVPASAFLGSFASDRSHMRNADGTFIKPPPQWPCIGTGASNLEQYIDMEDKTTGRVFEYDDMRTFIDDGDS